MEYLKTESWNNITTYPHCCIGEGIHSVCVYIEDDKKIIGVPRKAIYNRFGLNIDNDLYDTFTLDMDINYYQPCKSNEIIIDDQETKEALRQFGQRVYRFQESLIANYIIGNNDSLTKIKNLDNASPTDNLGNFEINESIYQIIQNTRSHRYCLYDTHGNLQIQFNNKVCSNRFTSILRNVVSGIIDCYKNLK